DWGVPLLEYFEADIERCDVDAERVFKQLASCLATAAHGADVIHCDISAENIAVRDGKAFIVDWTRAQLTTSAAKVPPALVRALKEKWRLDASCLQPLRWPNNKKQALIYASIRSLFHDGMDSLVDCFESVFYVILYTVGLSRSRSLSTPSSPPPSVPSAFKSLSSGRAVTALVKTGCLAELQMYLKHFGVSGVGGGLVMFLNNVRNLLFCTRVGIFAGGMLGDARYERAMVPKFAKAVLSDQTRIGEEAGVRELGLLGPLGPPGSLGLWLAGMDRGSYH
ncbi:hypothetical protein GGI21_004141, partial [Coemansia aciculifera]